MPTTPRTRRNPVAHAARRARAQRRVGVGARCTCGESRPEALVAGSTPLICAECQRAAAGRPRTDAHHVAGRANDDTTVPVPVNDHRAILSPDQQDWPRDTLENPTGDPVLRAAACIRGVIDTIWYVLEHTLGWVAGFLEQLSAWLTQTHGNGWWQSTPLQAFVLARAGVTR